MRANIREHKIISAMRIAVWVLLSCCVAAAPSIVSAAALPVDAYLEIEGGSIIGGAHVVTGGGSWSIRKQGGMTVGPTNAYPLRGPVSVNGVEYSGASTQALVMSDDAFMEEINFKATQYHPVISFGGFLNTGAYKNYAALDAFYIDSTAGDPWPVSPQIIADGTINGVTCAPCLRLEGTVSSRTTTGGKIPIKPGKTYWFSSMIDSPNRKLYLSVFDPDNNYALVGETSIVTDGHPTSSTLILRMARADSHTGNTPQGTKSYMDNILIDWTNHVYPLIPGDGGTTPPPPPAPVKPAPPTNLQVQ